MNQYHLIPEDKVIISFGNGEIAQYIKNIGIRYLGFVSYTVRSISNKSLSFQVIAPLAFHHTKYEVQSHNMTQEDVAIAKYKTSKPPNAKVISISGYGIPENIETHPINAIININKYELLTHTYSIIASVPIYEIPKVNNIIGARKKNIFNCLFIIIFECLFLSYDVEDV